VLEQVDGPFAPAEAEGQGDGEDDEEGLADDVAADLKLVEG
jgi:hypothetical protein